MVLKQSVNQNTDLASECAMHAWSNDRKTSGPVKQQGPKWFGKRWNHLFVFARWQHMTDGLAAICSCMSRLGLDPKSLLCLGSGKGII